MKGEEFTKYGISFPSLDYFHQLQTPVFDLKAALALSQSSKEALQTYPLQMFLYAI